jgi:hypothetical protein
MKVHDRLNTRPAPAALEIVIMAVSAIASPSFHAANHQTQSVSLHKHGGHGAASLSDIDTAGSSVASAPSATGKTGRKVDISA